MDSSYEGDVPDSMNCSKLSMEKRRDIVYELAKCPHRATEVLHTWSRQEILPILCTEMGKERKYTGLTKLKIIDQLLKVVSEKISEDNESVVYEPQFTPSVSQKRSKRSRKPENFSRLLVSSSTTNLSACITNNDSGVARYCKNVACKARLNNEDVFCKRCTCCICHKYDDNKDPSLWLTCNSEPPFPGNSCNNSCHLECALTNGRSGIARSKLVAKLDGCFYCISCGKMNDLMRCWRKQLTVAKETRRVDILCYRISLSQKLLSGTKKYQKLSKIVDNAVRVLESEVGALSSGPVKMGRGIVNRLSSGQQVQRLCASAVESFDVITCHASSHQDSKPISPIIQVEPVIAATNWNRLSNPSSVKDETTNIRTGIDLNENRTEDYFDYYKTRKNIVDPNSSSEPLYSTNASQDQNPSCESGEEQIGSDGQTGEAISTDIGSNDLNKSEQLLQPCGVPKTSLPVTPSRKETPKDGISKKGGSKSLRKAQENGMGKEEQENEDEVHNLEYYVKVIRWLECEGHIEESFRQKFLTWYSIRATPKETRIVKAFVDTLKEDPASLSEQLVDTFGELISCKRSSNVPHGFCLKLWH